MFKLASIVLAFLLSAASHQNPADNVSVFDKGRELLAAGEWSAAKIAVTDGLSRSPYSTEGYQLMYEIAKAEQSIEEQLRWGKWLTWSLASSGNNKLATGIIEELDAVYTDWNIDNLLLSEWQANTYKAAAKAASSKQYRLAGHLYSKILDENPTDKKTNKAWDKLVKTAGNEITGGAFSSAKVRRKSANWIEKNNAKHSTWDNRWQRKTKYYDVQTNLDYEFFETVCDAMRQVNEFYRVVYDYGRKKTKKVTLLIGATRTDFDRFTMKLFGTAIQSKSVGGYWSSQTNTVSTFASSAENKDDVWSTLFHEASHQFMSLVMAKNEKRGMTTPPWLNEGTSSYFEGCVITANGTILKNNIAERRLRSWNFLDSDPDSRITLEELIAHPRNTGPLNGSASYEGKFYPYGWAFVYFLLNYEEHDRRVYAPSITPGSGGIPEEYKAVTRAKRLVYREPYLKYLAHFSKTGNPDNDQFMPLELANKLFVEEVDDPDIKDWEAFEKRWRKFTQSLYREMKAGPDFADVLQARARGYLLAEDFERARSAAEQANHKRPHDAETFRLLAEAALGNRNEDEALFWMFRHWESVWGSNDADATTLAEKWILNSKGRSLLKLYIEPAKQTHALVESAMEKANADGHPICGTLYASHLEEALGINFKATNKRALQLSALAEQDLRLWQNAYVKSSASNRKSALSNGNLINVVVYEKDGVLINNPLGGASPGYERTNLASLATLTPPFSLRGEVVVDGDAALLFFGIGITGRPQSRIVIATSGNGDQVVEFQLLSISAKDDSRNAPLDSTVTGGAAFHKGDSVVMQFDFNKKGEGTYTINDSTKPIPEGFDASVLTGGFAIAASEDTAALFKNIEVRPNSAFWPVLSTSDDG